MNDRYDDAIFTQMMCLLEMNIFANVPPQSKDLVVVWCFRIYYIYSTCQIFRITIVHWALHCLTSLSIWKETWNGHVYILYPSVTVCWIICFLRLKKYGLVWRKKMEYLINVIIWRQSISIVSICCYLTLCYPCILCKIILCSCWTYHYLN